MDLEQRLVGIVTVDDVIDVIEQEATRDPMPPVPFKPVMSDYSTAICSSLPGAGWCGWRCWCSATSK